jgi:hypothetical protein
VVAWLAAASGAGTDVIGNLAIYCDVLVCNDTVTVGGSQRLNISIFARQIVHRATSAQSDATAAIQFKVVENSILTIWAQELPSPFFIEFVSGSDGEQLTDRQEFVLPDEAPGLTFIFDGADTQRQPQQFVNVDLNTENWLSLLNSDGTLKEVPFLSE